MYVELLLHQIVPRISGQVHEQREVLLWS